MNGSMFNVLKSYKQRQLEKQGCVFQGQELLDNHEFDPEKECYCGRPNKRAIPKDSPVGGSGNEGGSVTVSYLTSLLQDCFSLSSSLKVFHKKSINHSKY